MSRPPVYALKQPHPDGSEWIQEHDSLEAALRYQSHSGGVLVRRQEVPGEPGLWWVEMRTQPFDERLWRITGHDEDGYPQYIKRDWDVLPAVVVSDRTPEAYPNSDNA